MPATALLISRAVADSNNQVPGGRPNKEKDILRFKAALFIQPIPTFALRVQSGSRPKIYPGVGTVAGWKKNDMGHPAALININRPSRVFRQSGRRPLDSTASSSSPVKELQDVRIVDIYINMDFDGYGDIAGAILLTETLAKRLPDKIIRLVVLRRPSDFDKLVSIYAKRIDKGKKVNRFNNILIVNATDRNGDSGLGPAEIGISVSGSSYAIVGHPQPKAAFILTEEDQEAVHPPTVEDMSFAAMAEIIKAGFGDGRLGVALPEGLFALRGQIPMLELSHRLNKKREILRQISSKGYPVTNIKENSMWGLSYFQFDKNVAAYVRNIINATSDGEKTADIFLPYADYKEKLSQRINEIKASDHIPGKEQTKNKIAYYASSPKWTVQRYVMGDRFSCWRYRDILFP